jgi:cystathionine gamma-synthase
MKGFGGILSFLLKENSLDAVGRFIPHLRFAHAAGNLGAVETIVAPPATSSHVECTPEERARLGIPEGLIRYSTGIEQELLCQERLWEADPPSGCIPDPPAEYGP